MISEKKYTEILAKGLILDHYFLLCNIRDNIKPIQSKRIQGFINLLSKKGYIQDDAITEKALELIQGIDEQVEIKSTKKVNFAEWSAELHKKCQDKLKELTGSIQVRDKIEGTSYAFMPNPIDFGKKLYNAMILYKMKDYDKVEKCILSYIQQKYDEKKWFPMLEYYIMKFNKSKLATDYDNFTEKPEEKPSNPQTFV